MSRWRLLPLIAPVVFAATACEPCSGVSSCAERTRVSVEGRIVDVTTGRAVPGARVDIVRSGSTSPSDSASTVTDGYGLYTLAVAAPAPGQGTFDVVVSPPGGRPYRVSRVLSASGVHGEGNALGAWVSEPAFALSVELYLRASPNLLIKNTFATFVRTGGAHLTGPGWDNTGYRSPVDSFGRFSLFNNSVFSLDGADVVGDVYVELAPPRATSVIRDVHVPLRYAFGAAAPVLVIDAGPSAAYAFRFVDPTTGLPKPKVRVSFDRTGGIPLGTPSFSGLSNSDGQVVFKLFPLAVGTMVGNITVRPPPPDTGFVLQNARFDTFDGKSVQLFGEFGIGLHFPWAGTVRAQGKPIAGVQVDARRVGGIVAFPDAITVVSDANGSFPLRPFVPGKSPGNLVVDLTFRPPAPYASFVVHGVVLPTTIGDMPNRVLGVWDVDAPPSPSRTPVGSVPGRSSP